ncbi:hypothetical protein GF373_04510 [bacterium]|nr:hypothetical protein [bacterium]
MNRDASVNRSTRDASFGMEWVYSYSIRILILVGFVILLPGTATMPLVDRDEPRFAQATQEMMERGEWIIPYFNENYRFDKPVLSYWMMRIFYNLFGVNEFSARFHSILCTIGVAIIINVWGRRMFTKEAGFWAAFMWLTSVQVWIHGRLCLADMPMILAVAASNWALYALVVKPAEYRLRWFAGLYVSLGLGFLAKGPIAVVTPLLSLLLYRFVFYRKPLPWKNLGLQWGIPLFLLIVGIWGIPALIKTQGQFWEEGMNRHVIQRGVEAFNGRVPIPFVYYIFTAFLSLFPWIAYAGDGFVSLRRNWNPQLAYLTAWFLSPYIIFTFYATQLPHYVMPGFPAFFLLLAHGLHASDKPSRLGIHWFCWVKGVMVTLALAGIGFLALQHWMEATLPLFIALISLFVLLLFYASLSFFWRWQKKWGIGFILLLMAVCSSTIGTQLEKIVPAEQMKPLMRSMPAETYFIMRDFEEPSLIFYSNRHWQKEFTTFNKSQLWAIDGPVFTVLVEKEYRLEDYFKPEIEKNEQTEMNPQLQERVKQAGYTIKRYSGLNLARASWVKLLTVFRKE